MGTADCAARETAAAIEEASRDLAPAIGGSVPRPYPAGSCTPMMVMVD